jgi:hypothetical protein
LESWRRVFREGLEPVVSTPGLLALRQALLTDDPRLIQGATTTRPLCGALNSGPSRLLA